MKVTLAREYVTNGGKTHKADTTVDLPSGEARNLISLGLARLPDERPKPTPPKGANDERKDA